MAAPLVETPRVLLPDPLPHPYRSSNMFVAGDDDDCSDTTDIDDACSTSETLQSPPEKDEKGNSQPCLPLVHQRLKRLNHKTSDNNQNVTGKPPVFNCGLCHRLSF
jgi:hypothetical protein